NLDEFLTRGCLASKAASSRARARGNDHSAGTNTHGHGRKRSHIENPKSSNIRSMSSNNQRITLNGPKDGHGSHREIWRRRASTGRVSSRFLERSRASDENCVRTHSWSHFARRPRSRLVNENSPCDETHVAAG